MSNDDSNSEPLVSKSSRSIKGYLTVLAGFLMNLAAGSVNAWGFISVYVASYYHHDDSDINLGTMFVVYPISALFEGVGFIMGVSFYHSIGSRMTGTIGGLCYVATFIGCAYCPNAYLFAGIYGVMSGLATGLSTFTPVWPAWDFFPKNHGLVAGLIVFGYGLSPAFFGMIFTYLVNPNNESPNVLVTRGTTDDHLFSYNVAQNLPYALKCMSVVFAVIYFVSVLLIFQSEVKSTANVEESVASVFSKNVKRNVRECPDMNAVLHSQAFWVLGFALFAGSSYGIYIINAYKNYGMLHIRDDLALSTIGSIASVANAFGRMMLPVVLDYVSFKFSYSINSIIQILISATLYLTVTSQDWYCVWISISFVLFAGNFTGFAIEAGRIFGPKMGSYAFSYIGQGFTLSALLSIALDAWMLPAWGYVGCFTVLAGMSGAALLLCIVLKESW